LTSATSASGLTPGQIHRLVNKYVGVNGGYFGDLSYRTHAEFYMELDLPLNPNDIPGTTRERFIHILEHADPSTRAKIVDGVLKKYPVGSTESRTQAIHDEIQM
jgi:hypothetical protein